MSKRQEMREKRRRQERNQRIITISIVVVVALVFGFAFIYPNLKAATPSVAAGQIVVPASNPRPQAKFNAMGDPNAPVKIIEYADFQCPYCKRFAEDGTEAQIEDTYVKTGKVYFEYHSFGAFIGQESVRAAEAAYCAGDQNKFWEYHDILYANQGTENSGVFTDATLKTFAEKLGLDTNAFGTCLSSNKYATMVTQDGNDAQQAGVQATPSFVINGQLVQGAVPFSDFQKTIDAALASASGG